MKKLIKKSFAFAILAALPISYTANLHARHGWGLGLGLGLGTGVLIGAAASRGPAYYGPPSWSVYNDTDFPILVRGSGTGKDNFIQINPGQTVGVPRGRKPKLYAKHLDNPDRRPRSATMRSPNVTIAAPSGRIEFHVSSPPPQQRQAAPGDYYPNGYY